MTDALIPLFAIGAFLAFTASRRLGWWCIGTSCAGRVQRGTLPRMAINGLGAAATGITTLVVLVAKFVEGAWITAILVPVLILLMTAVRRHYQERSKGRRRARLPMRLDNLIEPLVIVPVDRWTRISEKALRFALKLSDEVEAVHVDAENCADDLCGRWERLVAEPFRQAGREVPPFTVLPSPFRLVLMPLVDHILELEWKHPTRQIAVLVPELVVKKWWQAPLHNQRAQLFKLLLLLRGNGRIIVVNIPWYL